MRGFFGSMLGRVFLLLIGGIIISALITHLLAGRERQQVVSQFFHFRAVERVVQFISLLDTVPAEARPQVLAVARGNGIIVDLVPTVALNIVQDADLTDTLRQRVGPGIRIVASAPVKKDCPTPPPRLSDFDLPLRKREFCQIVNATLHDGTPVQLKVRLEPPPPRLLPPWLPYPGLLIFLICLGVLAYMVAKMTMLPLRLLAQAATDFGRDIRHAPMAEKGPTEVRRAAAAFNAMQTQIRRYIHERTHMLAAITHDLQTPLTRLRLRLEKVNDEDLRGRLIGDLTSMQEMIREGLDLARSMDTDEAMQVLDLDSVLDSECADYAESGQDVATVNGHTSASVRAQPVALRRCLGNVISNAVKYGGFARVSAGVERGRAVIRVRDGGPGIPPDKLDAVFEPFYRLENSRSRETGGTGLGLTIARNIAERHGGSLKLRNHPDGGLEAILELPLLAVRPNP
ncbi:MAG TPA: ATP-binding protein [Gammaproteobacteria bacterium]|nr:ATP-binding protein [Gammaproteobacteria bacterium]